MASSGPLSPGSSSQSGGTSWSNSTSGILASGGTRSDGGPVADSSSETSFLYGVGFGFAVPSSATINGIVLEIRKRDDTGAGIPRDKTVTLLKAGTVSGDNKAETTTDWSSFYSYVTYGSASDLWGTTWSYSDINNANFGAGISVTSNGASSAWPTVDHIRITVYYTEATGGAAIHHYRQQGMMRHQQPRLILPSRELITEIPQRIVENKLAI